MDSPKKAVYYERVSTEHDSQDESMENQRRLVESYLNRHPEITLAEPLDTYSERISAKSDERPQYSAMLQRIAEGDISYILVKDLKRLNRSTEVSAQLRNHAKAYGFKLILLSTGQIYDLNASENRMMYGFESLINEDYVFRQSEYGRLAHRQKMDAKRLNSNNCTVAHGWNYELGDMYVIEEKAEVIRKVFDLYVFHNYTLKQLQEELDKIGWSYSITAIRKWLKETAFVGKFCMNKRGSELGVGAGQKTKRFENPSSEWVTVDRPDLAVVEPDIFELAQRIRKARQEIHAPDSEGKVQSRFQGIHLFSGIIFCAECGYQYVFRYADRAQTIGYYRDCHDWKKRKSDPPCTNVLARRVYEEDLIKMVLISINSMISDNHGCFEQLLEVVADVLKNIKSHDVRISNIQKELHRLEKIGEKTRQAYIEAEGPIRQDLAKDYESLVSRKEELQQELTALENLRIEQADIDKKLSELREYNENLEPLHSLDRAIVNRFVDKILIHKDGKIEIILKGMARYTFEYAADDIAKKEREQGDLYPAPFAMPENIMGKDDRYTLLYKAFMTIHETSSVTLPLIEFAYETKDNRFANHQDKIKRFTALAEIIIHIDRK